MLSALSNYLQNLPLPSSDVATRETKETRALRSAEPQALLPGDYSPSTRAILVSAVASDFDVQALSGEQVGDLQLTLQQYGLMHGHEFNAFSILNTARSEETDAPLNALNLVKETTTRFDELGTPYSERQRINKLNTLLHNIASARTHLGQGA